ncbi:lytic transglycosylase domain-containing protein [Chakrabartia godavariana]|nr:lytic transglycosylase domain-containing protein [Chakrabartia godavariana]
MLSYGLRAFLLSSVLFAAHAVNAETPDLPSAAATFPLPAPVVQPLPVTDPITSALSQWNMLRRNDNLPFSAYANFLAVNQGWPGEAAFRKNAERAIKPGVDSASAIIAFFRKFPPQSPTAFLRYAEALDEQDRRDEAADAARSAWTGGALSTDDEVRLLTRFGSVLTLGDHDRRMDKLLWQRATPAATRQIGLTSPTKRPLFDVRLALLTKAADAPDRLAYATASLRADPGFFADYMWWLRNTGQSAVARQILRNNASLSAFPSAPDVWLQMLLISAQDAAKDGDWQVAYDISSRAGTAYPPGTVIRDRPFGERDAYTDLVWMAGTTALNRLTQPENAARMFQLYAAAAKSPQTQARGLYWAGRSLEAAGRRSDALPLYESAARFFDQFHGQLASERLGRVPRVRNDDAVVNVSAAQRENFNRRTIVRALIALGQSGNWVDQSLFVRSLANAVDNEVDHVLATELAARIARPDLNVMIGRNARNTGLANYVNAAFPQVEVPPELTSSWTMIHAISRQESQFDKEATSRVGARGLMQLMPATARDTAPRAGLAYNYESLGNPQYNMALGSTYFGRLMDMYGGSYVLAVAAYNAGPGNVNRWLRAYGDPRSEVDVLTWIENIPLSETRNYVQRVLENAVVYDLLNPVRATVRSSTPLSTYLGKRYPG